MTAIRHERAKELFLEACELDAAERARHLDAACAGDAALRAEVDELLANDAQPAAFLEGAESGRGARYLGSVIATQPAGSPHPQWIGEYRILRLIGEGGMGRVYEAEQLSPRRRVALKTLRGGAHSTSQLRRFEHEAQLLGRLNHPGIAHVYAAGTQVGEGGPTPFIAMELIDGEPLDQHAASKALDLRQRLELFASVCDAVQHAHQHGVIHRDLKPGNILVDRSDRPRVLDFGVARLLASDDGASQLTTGAGAVIGTLRYMSPEQISEGSDKLDTRSDVYSLGVIAFELLARRSPYQLDGVSLPQAVRLICESEPPLLGSLDRGLRGDVETIVAKALAKDRDRRYDSVAELAADVRRSLRDEPIVARPASTMYQLAKFARRNTALVAGAALTIAALVAGAITATWFARKESLQRQLAEQRSTQNQVLRAAADSNAYRANVLSASLALRYDNPRFARELLSRLTASEPAWEHARLKRMVERWIDEFRAGIPYVWFVAFTPDGRSVVAVGRTGGAVTWDLATGTATSSVPADRAREECCALSRDGSLAASISGTTLKLWSTATGQVENELELGFGVGRWVTNTAAFSPDGRRLIVAVPGQAMRALEVPSLAAQYELARAAYELKGLAFSGDGSRLVTVQNDRPTLWSAADGTLLGTCDRVVDARSAALDFRGDLLAVGTQDDIHLIDTATGHATTVFPGHPELVTALAFDAADQQLAALLDDSSMWIWNVHTGAVQRRYWVGRAAFRTALAWSPTDALVVTGTHTTRELRLWDARATQAPEVLVGHTSYVYPVIYTPDGAHLISGSWDRTIRVWRADDGAALHTLSEHRGWIRALAAAPDSRRFASVASDGALLVSDLVTGALVARAPENAPWESVAWSPDGRTLAAGTHDGSQRIVLLDAGSLERIGVLGGHSQAVNGLAFDPRGPFLVSGSADRTLHRWDLRTRESIAQRSCELAINCVSTSRDGRLIAVAGHTGQLLVCDADTLATVQTFVGHAREVFAAAFSPDATRLFSGGRDGELHVWDVASGALLGQFDGHSDYIWSVAVEPRGKRVATGSGDFTVRQWETESARDTYRRSR